MTKHLIKIKVKTKYLYFFGCLVIFELKSNSKSSLSTILRINEQINSCSNK